MSAKFPSGEQDLFLARSLIVIIRAAVPFNLNFCCSEIKFKLDGYICANATDVVNYCAVIKKTSTKRTDCILLSISLNICFGAQTFYLQSQTANKRT